MTRSETIWKVSRDDKGRNHGSRGISMTMAGTMGAGGLVAQQGQEPWKQED